MSWYIFNSDRAKQKIPSPIHRCKKVANNVFISLSLIAVFVNYSGFYSII